MACKRINKRVMLKILAIGLFFAGLWLLTYSHVIYVEEQVNGQSVSSDESSKVKMMDTLAGCCILVSLVLNLAGSFAKDTYSVERHSCRAVSKAMMEEAKRRKGRNSGGCNNGKKCR